VSIYNSKQFENSSYIFQSYTVNFLMNLMTNGLQK